MDKDKLNEAAGEDWCDNVLDRDLKPITKQAFKRGAQWLMQQPLSDRLTEEEKEKIYGYLRSILFVYSGGQYLSLEAIKEMFIDIFGKELFNKK